jgi:hypothetical protein
LYMTSSKTLLALGLYEVHERKKEKERVTESKLEMRTFSFHASLEYKMNNSLRRASCWGGGGIKKKRPLFFETAKTEHLSHMDPSQRKE